MGRRYHKLLVSYAIDPQLPEFSAVQDHSTLENLVFPGNLIAECRSLEIETKVALRFYGAGAGVTCDSDGNIHANTYGILRVTADEVTIVQPLVLNEDQTEAVLYLPARAADQLAYEDILAILDERRIIHMIPPEKIKQAMRSEVAGWVVIARGKAPEKGRSQESILFFEQKSNSRDQDRIDYRESSLLLQVEAGQPVLEIKPEIPGTPGYTITGAEIPAVYDREPCLRPGRGLVLDKTKSSGEIYCAAHSGAVQVLGGTVNVLEIYCVEGDVDLSTGNIRYHGTVVVEGSIRDGMQLEAGGDLVVKKMIEPCNISCAGSIQVLGGILGKSGLKIKAGDMIIAAFAQNANLVAGGDIFISQGITNSIIFAAGAIVVGGGPGKAVSGILAAHHFISVIEAGTDRGSYLTLRAGVKKELEAQKIELEKEIVVVKENIDKLLTYLSSHYGIHRVEDLAPLYCNLAQDEKVNVSKFIKTWREQSFRLQSIRNQFSSIQKILIAPRQPRIEVKKIIHSGVHLIINEKHVVNEGQKAGAIITHSSLATW